MAQIVDDEYEGLRRRVIDCFKYRAYTQADEAAALSYAVKPDDPYVNYYHALSLFELGRAKECLERLSYAAKLSPRAVFLSAAGQYLSRRLTTDEGYRHEDGWIMMLDVALDSGVLPVHQLTALGPLEYSPSMLQLPSLIPKRIIQFWDADQPPQEVAGLMDRIKLANPDFGYERFSEHSARDFIRSSLGSDVVPLFDACPHVAAKSDFFRVAYLMEHGGIYVDADEVCDGSLSAQFCHKGYELILSFTRSLPSCINNWFIATKPRSALLEKVMTYILGNLRNVVRHGPDTNVWVLTGPGVWTFSVIDLAIDVNAHSRGTPYGKACFLDEVSYRSLFKSPAMKYKEVASGNWRTT